MIHQLTGGSQVILDVPHPLVLGVQHGVKLVEESLQRCSCYIGQHIQTTPEYRRVKVHMHLYMYIPSITGMVHKITIAIAYLLRILQDGSFKLSHKVIYTCTYTCEAFQ